MLLVSIWSRWPALIRASVGGCLGWLALACGAAPALSPREPRVGVPMFRLEPPSDRLLPRVMARGPADLGG